MAIRVCTVPSSADTSAVERCSAVGDSGGPFTHDEPKVVVCVASELVGAITHELRDESQSLKDDLVEKTYRDVILPRSLKFCGTEDLIDMLSEQYR